MSRAPAGLAYHQGKQPGLSLNRYKSDEDRFSAAWPAEL